MGDRGNIYVVDSDPEHGIYIYSHWEGGDLPRLLGNVLTGVTARSRYGDAPYLTRIVCTELFGSVAGPTGWGVSTFMSDNDSYPVMILDVRGAHPTVWFAAAGEERDPDSWFASVRPGEVGELSYPRAGEHWRVEYRREASDPWRWKYEATKQAARAWANSGLGEDLSDVGQIQEWNGMEWR